MPASVAHIFGSEAKVKIMRLFIFNPNLIYTASEVRTRAKVTPSALRKELGSLLKAGLVKKKGKGYSLNRAYRYLGAIGNFLIDANPLSEKEIVRRISTAGNIKLILTSGVFVHNPDSRVDILIVGDNIRQTKLLTVMSTIEAELGRELRYAVFETSDFQYRLGIYDKLIRDILDSQHEKILNKLGLQPVPTSAPTIHRA
jgi:DNA-binding transcriptional ArsR family regulator